MSTAPVKVCASIALDPAVARPMPVRSVPLRFKAYQNHTRLTNHLQFDLTLALAYAETLLIYDMLSTRYLL